MPIYLDNNATTPCAPEVVEAMIPFYSHEFGNPASPHAMGTSASAAVEKAREQVAELLGCGSEEIIFTSGATESNNLALLGAASASSDRNRIVTTAVEHKSVLEPCDWLSQHGFDVVTIPVDRDGAARVEEADALIDERTVLVSVQAANNEVGTLQPVREIAAIAHSRGAFVYCDCAQVLGKVPVSVYELDVDYASCSAHKVYGPKGVGALFVRNGPGKSHLWPILFGGGQEDRLRPGTLNVPGIVGFGEACRLAAQNVWKEMHSIAMMRDSLERRILDCIEGVSVNGSVNSRLPGTTSLTFPGIPADVLIARLPGICISDGSACTSGTVSPSHVLLAMGRSDDEARCTVRLSLGRYNSRDEIDIVVDQIVQAARAIRPDIIGTQSNNPLTVET